MMTMMKALLGMPRRMLGRLLLCGGRQHSRWHFVLLSFSFPLSPDQEEQKQHHPLSEGSIEAYKKSSVAGANMQKRNPGASA
jgi:hypothetical protein